MDVKNIVPQNYPLWVEEYVSPRRGSPANNYIPIIGWIVVGTRLHPMTVANDGKGAVRYKGVAGQEWAITSNTSSEF